MVFLLRDLYTNCLLSFESKWKKMRLHSRSLCWVLTSARQCVGRKKDIAKDFQEARWVPMMQLPTVRSTRLLFLWELPFLVHRSRTRQWCVTVILPSGPLVVTDGGRGGHLPQAGWVIVPLLWNCASGVLISLCRSPALRTGEFGSSGWSCTAA